MQCGWHGVRLLQTQHGHVFGSDVGPWGQASGGFHPLGFGADCHWLLGNKLENVSQTGVNFLCDQMNKCAVCIALPVALPAHWAITTHTSCCVQRGG